MYLLCYLHTGGHGPQINASFNDNTRILRQNFYVRGLLMD